MSKINIEERYGIYLRGCGLDNCIMRWSTDEYIYQLLKHNNTKFHL